MSVPPDKTWSHSADGRRDEGVVYRLPQSEVLPFLMSSTTFSDDSSSPANDESRRVIYGEQYPQLHGPVEPLGSRPDWSGDDVHDWRTALSTTPT